MISFSKSKNQNPPHTVIRNVMNPYKWAFYAITFVWILTLVFGVSYHNYTLERLKDAKASGIDTDQLLSLTNKYRLKSGIGELTSNPTITSAAQAKAEDMFKNQYFAHYRPSDNKRGISFVKDFGYDYQIAGENLAVHYETSQDVFSGWQNSSLHRQNLLNKEFDEVGFGVVSGYFEGHETFFVVQFLAKAQPTEKPPVVAPEQSINNQESSQRSQESNSQSVVQDYPESESLPISRQKKSESKQNTCPCSASSTK